jgi:DNA-binding transcriptional MerR regulator
VRQDGKAPPHLIPPSQRERPAVSSQTWTITEVAAEYDVTLRTIRHYEDLGLITPERRGTARIFHHRDRVRLALVLRGRRLGFSLDQIATIVNMYDAEPGEAGQLSYLIDQIAGRRAELEQRRRDIDQTLTELDEVERRCREDLLRLGTTTSGPTPST